MNKTLSSQQLTRVDSEILSLEEAQALYATGDAAHDFDHVLRVTQTAVRLAESEGADVTVVRLAALLHDVPVQALLQTPAYAGFSLDGLPQTQDARHAHHLEAAAFARTFLLQRRAERGLGLVIGNEMIESIVHSIQAHRFRDRSIQPQTLEAKCLYDADKLDSIGAIGVARTFAYAGNANNRLWTMPWREIVNNQGASSEGRGAGDGRFDRLTDRSSPLAPHYSDYTPVHEFVYKLRVIVDTLYTQSARHIGEARHQRMVEFFTQLDQEMNESNIRTQNVERRT